MSEGAERQAWKDAVPKIHAPNQSADNDPPKKKEEEEKTPKGRPREAQR